MGGTEQGSGPAPSRRATAPTPRGTLPTSAVPSALLFAGLGLVLASCGSPALKPPSTQGAQRIASSDSAQYVPPKLPASRGLTDRAGLQEVSSASMPLWLGKDGYGPFAPAELGLRGGLSQTWLSTAAVNSEDALRPGLRLPLPLTFARAHPGPIEVSVQVRRFSNAQAPQELLASPDYSLLGSGRQGVVSTSRNAPHDGQAAQIYSAANGGLTEYGFEWADGAYWAEVWVVGYPLTRAQADAVAEQVTA